MPPDRNPIVLAWLDDIWGFQGHLQWLLDHDPHKYTFCSFVSGDLFLYKIRIYFQYNPAITGFSDKQLLFRNLLPFWNVL